MGRTAFAVKEVRVKPARQLVNLCGACGSEISASELLCKGCRHEAQEPPAEPRARYWGDDILALTGRL